MEYDAQSEKFKAQLLSMSKQPGNHECADCSSKSVKWACFNHGTFVCIKCSGIHRSLGRHISKVKSLTLDKWIADEMLGMCGNIAANSEYLYNLPDGLDKPDENDDTGRRKWIERKYMKLEWKRRDDQPPGQGSMERRTAVQQMPPCYDAASVSTPSSASLQSSVQPPVLQTGVQGYQLPVQQHQPQAPPFQPATQGVPIASVYSYPQGGIQQPVQPQMGVMAPGLANTQAADEQRRRQEMIQQIMLQQQQYQNQLIQYQQMQYQQPGAYQQQSMQSGAYPQLPGRFV